MTVVVPAFVAPLLATFTYRRAGLRWRSAIAFALLGALLAVGGGVILGLAYGFGVSTAAGLCGHTPAAALAAGVVAYLLVASWAALKPQRVWAWAFAFGAGIAADILVAYWFSGAHHYCET